MTKRRVQCLVLSVNLSFVACEAGEHSTSDGTTTGAGGNSGADCVQTIEEFCGLVHCPSSPDDREGLRVFKQDDATVIADDFNGTGMETYFHFSGDDLVGIFRMDDVGDSHPLCSTGVGVESIARSELCIRGLPVSCTVNGCPTYDDDYSCLEGAAGTAGAAGADGSGL